MKKIILTLLTLSILAFTSCQEYLETNPEDFSPTEQFYETEAQLNNALFGVYNSLAEDGTYARHLVIELANQTDETFVKRTGVAISPMLFNYDASHSVISITWKSLYDGINRANYLLANIDKPMMEEKKRSIIKGEALFLRAFFYFHLVSNWGDVPLLVEPTRDGKIVNIPQTSSAKVYEQILSDMIRAKDLVTTITQTGLNGRITKTAVQGILARVCLKMAGWPLKDISKYVDARAWADSVIQSGAHSLNPDYKQIFINHSADKYDSKECIWEVEFFGNNTSVPRLGSRFANQLAIRNTNAEAGYGYATLGVTPTLFNLYQSMDLRRDWTIGPYGYVNNNSLSTIPKTDIYSRDAGKWRRQYEVIRPLNVDWTSTNFPVLRYSDVLLMFAEADNEITGAPSQRAINYVNMVRRRGYGKFLNGPSSVSESIKSMAISNGGKGYNLTTEPVVVVISGGGGIDAKASVVVTPTTGAIASIKIDNAGTSFFANPDVIIRGGGGTGATASATIFPVSVADLQATQYANSTSFRQLIREERSRELAFEGVRKLDLIRWETYLDAMRKTGDDMDLNAPSAIRANQGVQAYFRVTNRHRLLPIPSADIALNKALVQNAGW
jgi:starch-binding outer membrane protein, SusD/RagB family